MTAPRIHSQVSGFCKHHGQACGAPSTEGAGRGCEPALPEEMTHTGDAVMSALAREWALHLGTIDEGSSDWVRGRAGVCSHFCEWGSFLVRPGPTAHA